MRFIAVLLVPTAVLCVDNGLGLTPPLGWRSFNAFWGIIDQTKMETNMDAMCNRSRKVGGKPTSLLDLGYKHFGIDGGWNYCFPGIVLFISKSCVMVYFVSLAYLVPPPADPQKTTPFTWPMEPLYGGTTPSLHLRIWSTRRSGLGFRLVGI